MYSTEMLIDAFKGLSKEQEEREKVGQPLLELDDIKARLATLSVEIRKETGFAYELRELLNLWDLYSAEECHEDPASCDCSYHENKQRAEESHEVQS